MSTTTIHLPEDLKKRAAERAGTSTHSFILQAIAEKAERQADFDATAEHRYTEIVASGKTISWHDMRTCLEARAVGHPAPRPKARKLAR